MIDPAQDARRRLEALLRLAHAGELAAAHAYRGHAASVTDPLERAEILAIEQDEWRHRADVRALLAALGSEPAPLREACMGSIGRTLGALCHVSGWLLPMFGAAVLETRNVQEYDDAAAFAEACDRREMIPALLAMADVELEHERYFKAKVRAHPLGRLLPLPTCTRREGAAPVRAQQA